MSDKSSGVPNSSVDSAIPPTTSDGSNSAASLSRPSKSTSIVVSTRQKGNPILKFVRSVPWEFGDITPDYQLGSTTCALYLSLRYHNLNPDYIHERLKQLAGSFNLRILLVLVDVKDPHHALKDLSKVCILADCTLILAFTIEEAGRYLETYKAFENKPPDLIMEKSESNYLARLSDTMTSIKKVNKTDAVTLLSTFGAARVHKVIHQSFVKETKGSK